MCNDNGNSFIATLHNILLTTDLRDRFFSIITLTNSGHNCFFHKGFCRVYFGEKEKNEVTLPHSAQRKHAFLGKIMKSQRKTNYQQKRNCFRITTSEIRTQIHQIIVRWGYCKFLGRGRAKNRSRYFLHIMSNFFNEQNI